MGKLANKQAQFYSLLYFISTKSIFDMNTLVISVVAFQQGVLSLSDLSISYMQQNEYHLSPSEMTYIQGIISFPWVVKPLWGLCTDMIPIFSYRRKSYLFIFGILGFIFWNLLAKYGVQNRDLGIFLLFCIQICIAFCNVVGEALLVETSKKNTENKNGASNNVSLFFGIKAFGTLLTSFLSGYALNYFKKQQIFQITSIFPLLVVTASIFLDEKRVVCNSQQNKINASCNTLDQKKAMQQLAEVLRIPEYKRPIILIFMFMLTPSSSSAMFFFNTNILRYSTEFMGAMKFFYAFANISAILFYKKYLKNVPFNKMFFYASISYSFINLFSTLLVTRKNLQLGIPDQVFSLSDIIILQIVVELNMLPILVLACKICPANIEGSFNQQLLYQNILNILIYLLYYQLGTMYAYIMAAINMGQLIAKQLGGILMHILGVTPYQFDNLWILIVIQSFFILTPLLFLSKIKEEEIMKIKEQREQEQKEGEDNSEKQQIMSNQMFIEKKINWSKQEVVDYLSLSFIEEDVQELLQQQN